MNASESLLALYRAARDFTRRAASAEDLERAAIAHAEARGFRLPREATPLAYAGTDRDDHPILVKLARCFAGPVGDGKMRRARELIFDYVRACGWVRYSGNADVEVLSTREPRPVALTVNVTADRDAVIAEQRRRISELRIAIESTANRLDECYGRPNEWVVREIVDELRKVLG